MSNSIRDVTPENPVYVTKYALTTGIQIFTQGEIIDISGTVYFSTKERFNQLYRMEHDAHETAGAAEYDAKVRAMKKMTSLEKQLKKMQLLSKLPKWAAVK